MKRQNDISGINEFTLCFLFFYKIHTLYYHPQKQKKQKKKQKNKTHKNHKPKKHKKKRIAHTQHKYDRNLLYFLATIKVDINETSNIKIGNVNSCVMTEYGCVKSKIFAKNTPPIQ